MNIFEAHPNYDPSLINKQVEENFYKIQDAYLALLTELGKVPTIKQISERAKLNPGTVAKHLKNLRISDLTPKHKIKMDRILNKLAELAEAGTNVRAIELYFKIVGGFVEKGEIINRDGNKVIRVEFVDKNNGENKLVEEAENIEDEREFE